MPRRRKARSRAPPPPPPPPRRNNTACLCVRPSVDGHTSCRLCAKHDARFRRRNAERSFVTKRLPVYSVPRAEDNSAEDNSADVQVIGDVGAAVSIKAANWSLGERQIICLARCE